MPSPRRRRRLVRRQDMLRLTRKHATASRVVALSPQPSHLKAERFVLIDQNVRGNFLANSSAVRTKTKVSKAPQPLSHVRLSWIRQAAKLPLARRAAVGVRRRFRHTLRVAVAKRCLQWSYGTSFEGGPDLEEPLGNRSARLHRSVCHGWLRRRSARNRLHVHVRRRRQQQHAQPLVSRNVVARRHAGRLVRVPRRLELRGRAR